MIAWSIGAAKQSAVFDRIVVSTDDTEIADIARDCGAEVPFTRPAELANDLVGTTAVMAHATRWLTQSQPTLSAICCIYPTAALLQPDDIVRGLAALESGDWAFSITVTEFAAPISRSFKQLPSGGLAMYFPEHALTRTQDLPIAFHDAGQMYWGRPDSWLRELNVFESHTIPVMLPRWRVQDIDTSDDWRRAEILHGVISSGEAR
jgi:pseudaminic acid cytidylyltransferase